MDRHPQGLSRNPSQVHVEKVSRMRQRALKQDSLMEIVELANDSEISSIGTIVSGIIKIINDPKSNVKDLTEIIQIDPPLTARVLRMANSAYYAPPKSIGEIMRAIIWIGYDAVKELALRQKVCRIFDKDESIEGYSRRKLWKHSLAVALVGKMIYRREFGERGDNIYACGLLHDLGLIVFDQFCQNEFKYILRLSKREEINVAKAEFDTLGYDHMDLGQAIVEGWNIPEEMTVVIGNHHNPVGLSKRVSRMATTLYIADYCCQEEGIGYGDSPYSDKGTFHDCMKSQGIEKSALKLIVEEVAVEIEKMEGHGLFSNG